MSEFENVTAPPPPQTSAGPQEDRTIALITHLSGIVAGFIVPLIMWLINKDKADKPWLIDQSKEALNFQITIAIAYVAAIILTTITFGLLFFLPMLVWVGNLVFCILAAVKVNNGESYRYPFALRLIK
jgi:uncharacterized protein